ncbi:MAG TPA: alcohol dehydrogenase catalytic domain-containing protein [Blastocatellia bacterium]|jgi:L-iditol 2-dehydrogenase|nr:alcohol dehydrogenase catalytic domain-containing protein [Blastocatellia bacterium]
MRNNTNMHALTVCAPEMMELREIPSPEIGPRQILIKSGAVGLCGTDFHIYQGHANYNVDDAGRLIPFEERPQILGHEFCGVVVDVDSAVKDLKPGDRVVVDQGINCMSRAEIELCEYCATGSSHQCARYKEHGITGLPGALADLVAVPAINAVKIESDLPLEQAALTEPLACVTHSCEMTMRTSARYTFGGERPIRSVLICGAGPAGLLFTQYLRNVVGYDGLLIVTEPSAIRRRLAADYGATVIDPASVDLIEAVEDLTSGDRIQLLIESAGAAQLFKQIPRLVRKQATMLLYGHGHHGVDLGVLNNIQFIETTLVTPTGASGGFDADGRPSVYRKSLELIIEGKINVSKFITHRYRSLEAVPQAFANDRLGADYIKGVAVL